MLDRSLTSSPYIFNEVIFNSQKTQEFILEVAVGMSGNWHPYRERMSGKGNCYDNAAMESFFHTMKLECTDDLNFENREEAITAIFDYIEIFYNNQRMHSYLGYKSPSAFEKLLESS